MVGTPIQFVQQLFMYMAYSCPIDVVSCLYRDPPDELSVAPVVMESC